MGPGSSDGSAPMSPGGLSLAQNLDFLRRTLKPLLYASAAGSLAVALTSALLGSRRDLVLSSVCAVMLLAFSALLARGHVRVSLWLSQVTLFCFSVMVLVTGSGMHDIGVFLFPILIVMGTLFIDNRARMQFLVLSVLAPGLVGLSEMAGIVVTRDTWRVGFNDVIIITVLLALHALTTTLLRRNLFAAFAASAASEQSYREVFNATGEAIVVCTPDDDHIIVEANRSAREMFQADDKEIIGSALDDWSLPASGGAVSRGIQEWVLRSDDGSGPRVEVSQRDCELGGNMRTLIVLRSVDALRNLRERAVKAQRLEALGLLAGGIAHDFNNQLGAISMCAELLHKKTEGLSRELVENVLAAAKRSAALTEQLLAFSRRGKQERTNVDIQKIVRGVAMLLRRGVDKRIKIREGFDPDGSCVTAGDGNLLENALLNLGLNARDAMPDGGTLEFRVERVTLDEDQALERGVSLGDHVKVTISDTGCGMDDTTKSRLFEPFFTTKAEGTGLGLAVVLGTIQSHDGAIHVESTPARGTTFSIYLPHRRVRTAPPVSADGEPVTLEGVRVFLVDDEIVLAQAMSEMLRELGCEVTTANDGTEALARFRSIWNEIDVAVLDVDLPGLHGPDLWEQMKQISPDIPVLFVSGFDEKGTVLGAGNNDGPPFLTKPFEPHELQNAVASIAAGRR